jgi:hypothetical protein
VRAPSATTKSAQAAAEDQHARRRRARHLGDHRAEAAARSLIV